MIRRLIILLLIVGCGYAQKERGLGFITLPNMTTLEFYNIINDHLEYSLQYNNSRNKVTFIGGSRTQSNEMHQYQLSMFYSRMFKDKYRMLIGGGFGFANIIWKDLEISQGGRTIYFKNALIGGIGIKLFNFTKPIPIQLGCKILFEFANQPNYEITGRSNNTISYDDSIIDPKLIFLISFPK